MASRGGRTASGTSWSHHESSAADQVAPAVLLASDAYLGPIRVK